MKHEVHDLADPEPTTQLLADLACQGLLRRLPRLDLAAGEFPGQRKGLVGPPLREQNTSPSLDEGRHHEQAAIVLGTLGGFPNPPALWLRRAKPAFAYAIVSGTLGGFPSPPAKLRGRQSRLATRAIRMPWPRSEALRARGPSPRH